MPLDTKCQRCDLKVTYMSTYTENLTEEEFILE